MNQKSSTRKSIAIVGAGPAGLMAASTMGFEDHDVVVFDAMPSPARKLLMAGKSGLNLTHNEPLDKFLDRYACSGNVEFDRAIRSFPADQIRSWASDLGTETFIGSSGRIFPKSMKASPLLRAWLQRLDSKNVSLRTRHKWIGWGQDGKMQFETPTGLISHNADLVLLAMGGASWPRLGTTGAWNEHLQSRDVSCQPFQPSNCGFNISWTEHLISRFAGTPLKSITLSCDEFSVSGDTVISQYGLEGGAIYTISRALISKLKTDGKAELKIDLRPGVPIDNLLEKLSRPRGKQSLSNHLRKNAGLDKLKVALLFECLAKETFQDIEKLANAIKALPVKINGPRPMTEGISTSGGVAFEELDQNWMLHKIPGVFCAGEMLDWDAPTGGYLIAACLAQGKAAGAGMLAWLNSNDA
ncbi:MAG: TIGR03862 family flavoprotein [Cohaesibacteraceae bacterium]|nr:TIGR03862 family flavoprotein [Cohaesibacteraceae bacterium]